MTREEYLRYGLETELLKFSEYLELTKPLNLPDGLEEAAERYAQFYDQDLSDENGNFVNGCGDLQVAFKSGAKWDRAKMMEKAVEGVVQYDGQFINLGDERYIDLNPTIGLKPVFELNDGDKVKVIIIPEE